MIDITEEEEVQKDNVDNRRNEIPIPIWEDCDGNIHKNLLDEDLVEVEIIDSNVIHEEEALEDVEDDNTNECPELTKKTFEANEDLSRPISDPLYWGGSTFSEFVGLEEVDVLFEVVSISKKESVLVLIIMKDSKILYDKPDPFLKSFTPGCKIYPGFLSLLREVLDSDQSLEPLGASHYILRAREKKGQRVKKSKKIPLHECGRCVKAFLKMSQLKHHLEIDHSRKTKRVTCFYPNCGVSIGSYSGRISHIYATHLKHRTFACDLCTKCFYYPSGLKRHMRHKHLIRCGLCERDFLKESFELHLQREDC